MRRARLDLDIGGFGNPRALSLPFIPYLILRRPDHLCPRPPPPQDFRAGLSKGLAAINRRWRDVFPDSDQRLRPLVEGLSQRQGGGAWRGQESGRAEEGLEMEGERRVDQRQGGDRLRTETREGEGKGEE